MAPTRSTPSSKSKHAQRKTTHSSSTDAGSLPGVQKLKSSLRQTRRLLNKDSLAADVRIETERRLKSLEGDLAKAERSRKERNFAVKYHKIKFFERQKVCRKIKHAKKQLDAPDLPPESLPSLREALFSHRVDLNYILHYPKTKKYISLFPPDASTASESSGTDKQREELRQWVSAAMKNGEMDAEPEERMDKGSVQHDGVDMETEEMDTNASRKRKHKEVSLSKPRDAFFEESDNEGDHDG